MGGIFFRCEFLRGMNFFASQRRCFFASQRRCFFADQRRCFFADQRRCFFSRATNVGAFLCEKRIGVGPLFRDSGSGSHVGRDSGSRTRGVGFDLLLQSGG